MTIILLKNRLRRWRFFYLLMLVKVKLELCLLLLIYIKKQTSLLGRGRLRMSYLYGNHMILQCEETLQIQGEARPGAWVTVRIAGQNKKNVTQSDGRWSIALEPLSAGGPYVLRIETQKKELIYRDVYAGEIWICSGQSNMAVPVGDSLTKLDVNAENKGITNKPFRCFCVDPIRPPFSARWSFLITHCINIYYYSRIKGWKECTLKARKGMSAVAYYYGHALSQQLQKPIGLIINPVGGTAEYSWIEHRYLQKEYPEILTNWYENGKVTSWMKKRAMLNLGKQYLMDEQLHPFYPGYCFEVFVRPIKDYTIKGVVWFAGESSAQLDDIDQFEKLQELLIKNWRESWGTCFFFHYVQLAGLKYEQSFGRGIHYFWPEVRNSQRRMLKKIPRTGMAVSYDLADIDKVHFKNRQPVGERLARLALYDAYGRQDITPCGPLFSEAILQGKLIHLRFFWSDGLCTKDGGEPRTFEVAGRDRCFYSARSWIEGDEIVLSCPLVTDPYWVHYAFDEYPEEANLVNKEGLPAACFEEEIVKGQNRSSDIIVD